MIRSPEWVIPNYFAEQTITAMESEAKSMNGDEVVISGISGIFPKSSSVLEFGENLYNMVDMVIVNHVFENSKIPELPKHMGKISDLEKFDAQFFKVSYWQVIDIDPLCRKLMEHTFNAIFDAGVNPATLAGKRIGVYAGSSFNDHFAKMMDTFTSKNQFVPVGVSSAMLANRISYWLDSKFPSYTLDFSCVTSSLCLEKAVNDIKLGFIDAAIVGGTNACNNPVLNYNLRKAGLLCLDGKTRCFDKNGDGYVRSEAVTSLFLQRAKDAKRIYAEICHVKGGYLMRQDAEFLPKREVEDLINFIQTFYKEVNVSPKNVEYIEANGSGIVSADKNELDAIDRVFRPNGSLKIGSVKSNMGHTDAASGICSVIKMCLAYRSGIIPANLHYSDAIDNDAILNNRLQVVVENTLFDRGYTAINNFSFTGGNFHILLKGHYKPKDKNRYRTSIPYLVVASGRQETSVNKVLDLLSSQIVDAEQIALLHDIYQHNIPGHTGRGYVILDIEENKTRSLSRGFEYYSGEPRPIWFVYSGMGSQWPGMGADLMKIPIFAKSIVRLQDILKPKGVDIIHILTTKDKNVFDNILYCFVAISAMQIGLTDILKDLRIEPDYLIGHSLGEHGCAYADGCLTAEEMILSSYYRGLVSIETEFIYGAMAAIGLGYEEVKDICPSEIEIACRNSSTSSTISGPAAAVSQFVAKLTSQGVFAKEVNTANIAYHSRYVAEGAAKFLKTLDNLINNPKKRSKKWLCTSQPEDKWSTADYCTGEYFTNNFLNPVYFEETAKKIPENAIVIEIAPHGLLQAILKRSHPNCTHIPLTRKSHRNSAAFLLEAIGQLYQSGLNPKVDVLYPQVEFPVSTETPLLSHFIEWEHSEEWPIDNYKNIKSVVSTSRQLDISIDDEDCVYFKDYIRNGANVLPEAAILVFVWETMAMYKEMDYNDLSVLFKKVYFVEEIIISIGKTFNLRISIQKGSGKFEVSSEKTVIAHGFIYELPSKKHYGINNQDNTNKKQHDVCLNSNEVYKKIFESKGFCYGSKFQIITEFRPLTNEATIEWRGDWVTFLDGLIQLNTLIVDHECGSRIKFIEQLRIYVHVHANEMIVIDEGIYYNAIVKNDFWMSTRCGGVTLDSVIFGETKNNLSDLITPHIVSYEHKDEFEVHSSEMKNRKTTVFAEIPKFATLQYIETDQKINERFIKICYSGHLMSEQQVAARKDIKNINCCETDFSGNDDRGQRVMGVLKSGVRRNIVPCDSDLIWPVPEHWSMEDAATVPLPYLVAYYCLTVRSNVMEGFSVLIIDGANTFGQALITLCLSVNCDVYVTVNDRIEKNFLLKLFPALNDTKIACNNEVALLNLSAFATIPNRCQIVVNFGSGELRQVGLKFVSDSGQFLDVSQTDMKENQPFGMYYLFGNRCYVAVRISSLFNSNNVEERMKLKYSISDGIARGIVKPLTRVVYSYEDINTTGLFNMISPYKHKCKVLINMQNSKITSDMLSRTHHRPEDVIIIICEVDEITVQLIEYMINRGVQKFVIYSRQEIISNYLRWKILKWNQQDVTILIESINLELESDINSLLHISTNIGSLKGVFIVQSAQQVEDINANIIEHDINNNVSSLQHVDVALRISPKIIGNLVLIFLSSGGYAHDAKIERLIQERQTTGLPIVYIQVVQCDKSTQANFSHRNVLLKLINAVDIGLTSDNNCITIDDSDDMSLNSCFGNNSECEKSEDSTTLEQNLRSVQLEELKTLMQPSENLTLNDNALRTTNVTRLKDMCPVSTKSSINTNINTGLNAVFSVLTKDHFLEKETFVKMKTLTSVLNENEFNTESVHLIMIPGFEGHYRIFERIAEKLKVAAVTLQVLPHVEYGSIEEIAAYHYKNIKTKIKTQSKFYILGYSFGVNIALELAAFMENEGYTGIIFCLDSSPEAVPIYLNAYLGKLTNNELQNAIIEYVFMEVTGQNSQELKNALKRTKNEDEKIEMCLLRLRSLSYSNAYVTSIIKTTYRRILFAREYNPNFELESEMVLLRGISHPNTGLSEDYGLSKYTKKPIQVIDIDSDHALAPYDFKVANIINKILDPKLLRQFNKRNLCDTYLVM